MPTFTAPPSSSSDNASHPAVRFVRAAARTVATIAERFRHRREVSDMLEMDDRMLKDVGLVRSDVLGALAQPWLDDPSATLRARSIDHRTRRRAIDDRTDCPGRQRL